MFTFCWLEIWWQYLGREARMGGITRGGAVCETVSHNFGPYPVKLPLLPSDFQNETFCQDQRKCGHSTQRRRAFGSADALPLGLKEVTKMSWVCSQLVPPLQPGWDGEGFRLSNSRREELSLKDATKISDAQYTFKFVKLKLWLWRIWLQPAHVTPIQDPLGSTTPLRHIPPLCEIDL